MKRIPFFATLAAGFFSFEMNCQAVTIFTQDFNSSSTVADYISVTPSSGQFDAMGSSGANMTLSVTSAGLTFNRNGGNLGSFSRTTDFSPTPLAITYRMDLTVSGNTTSQTSAAVFQIGSGFGAANSAERNADTYARFAINFGGVDGKFSIRDISNGTSSAEFSGVQSLFWVLNNSGATIAYDDPNSASSSIVNDTADLWVGTTKILNGVDIQTASQTMTDLKFSFEQGTGIIAIDNISMNTIPEPSSMIMVFFGAFGLLFRRSRTS